MGKGRTWTSEEKAKIVVQGLKGRRVAEISERISDSSNAVLQMARAVFRKHSEGL